MMRKKTLSALLSVVLLAALASGGQSASLNFSAHEAPAVHSMALSLDSAAAPSLSGKLNFANQASSSLTISGPPVVGVDQSITLTASGGSGSIWWECSDENSRYVELLYNDNICIVQGIRAGRVTITANSDSGMRRTVTIDIVRLPTSFKLNDFSLEVGVNQYITLTPATSGLSNDWIEWKSSNETVARVDPSGQVRTLRTGEAVITASILGTDLVASCILYVVANPTSGSGISGTDPNIDQSQMDWIIQQIRSEARTITIDMEAEDIWMVDRRVFVELTRYPDKFLIFSCRDYIWQFKGSDITEPLTVNLRVSFTSNYPFEINRLLDYARAQYISYEHNGRLPGMATFRVALRERLNQNGLILYFYNEQRNMLELRYSDLRLDSEKWVTYKISTCSDYVLTDLMVASAPIQSIPTVPNTGK